MKKKKHQQQPSLSKEQLEKILAGAVKNHTDLVKWLYDNYRSILREYEKTKGNLQIHFLNEKKEFNKFIENEKKDFKDLLKRRRKVIRW